MSHYILKIEINKYFWYVASGLRYAKGKINPKRVIGGIKGSCYNPNTKQYECHKFKKIRELISKEDFNIKNPNITITLIKDKMDKKEARKFKLDLCHLSISNQYFIEDIYVTPEDQKKREQKYKKKNYQKLKKIGYYQQESTMEKAKEWRDKNPKYNNEYRRNRYNTDIHFKTEVDIRNRLNQYLKINNINKNNSTMKSVGCSPKMLGDWIKFNKNVDNLTEHHLDHVTPLASFKCKDYDDVINSKCNHWTNLMPISPVDNLSKHDRMPTAQELTKQVLRVIVFQI